MFFYAIVFVPASSIWPDNLVDLNEERSAETEACTDLNVLGPVERKYSRRDDVRLLRRPPIHRIPHNNTTPRRTGSLQTATSCRVIPFWCRSGWNGDSNNIPIGPTPNSIRRTGPRASLYLSTRFHRRDSTTRRPGGLLSRLFRGCCPDSSLHGSVLHSIRGVPPCDGRTGLAAVRHGRCSGGCLGECPCKDGCFPIRSCTEETTGSRPNADAVRPSQHPGVQRCCAFHHDDSADAGRTGSISGVNG